MIRGELARRTAHPHQEGSNRGTVRAASKNLTWVSGRMVGDIEDHLMNSNMRTTVHLVDVPTIRIIFLMLTSLPMSHLRHQAEPQCRVAILISQYHIDSILSRIGM